MIDRKEDNQFHLVSKYEPSGDQPQAIEALVDNIEGGEKAQILKGATGTGKTYTMSQVIQRVNKPTLVIAHNKTLAGQLYGEFKEFFPDNAVEYFVSYYDFHHQIPILKKIAQSMMKLISYDTQQHRPYWNVMM